MGLFSKALLLYSICHFEKKTHKCIHFQSSVSNVDILYLPFFFFGVVNRYGNNMLSKSQWVWGCPPSATITLCCDFVITFLQPKGQVKIWYISVADPGFSRGGGVNPPGGAWTRQIFPKTAWNRKNLDAQGGACVPHAPPRSANAFIWKSCPTNKVK